MRIFYDKTTGEIVGTIDGFSDDKTEGMMIVPGHKKPEDISCHVIRADAPEAKIAKEFMDATHPRSVYDYRFQVGKGGLVKLSAKKIADRKALMSPQPAPPTESVFDRLTKQVSELQTEVEKLKANTNANQ